MNINPSPARGGGGITIVGGTALVPQEGPSGTIADIEKPKNSTIILYTVHAGESVASIAKMLGVPEGTILSVNDLPRGTVLKEGQKLIILPTPDIKYVVKAGDTLASIARRTGGDMNEIAVRNGLDDSTIVVGQQIYVPNGEVPAEAPKKKASPSTKPSGKSTEPARGVGARGTATQIGYYMAPVARYTETQGIHGFNAVDLAAPSGTPVYASADGSVVVARAGGWNGGYGSYVVISHGNGSQTLYSHMSKVTTYSGAEVGKGDVIGYVGQTGHATGPHLHFEIRNGIRNPF